MSIVTEDEIGKTSITAIQYRRTLYIHRKEIL